VQVAEQYQYSIVRFLLQIIKMTQTSEIATISGELHMLRSHHYYKVRERGGKCKRSKPPNLTANVAGLGEKDRITETNSIIIYLLLNF